MKMEPFWLGDKSWKKAKVVERLDDRSYEVEDTYGTPPSHGMPLAEPSVDNTPLTSGQPPPHNVERTSSPCSPRRSSRTTNVPAKYKDYVLSKQ